MDFVSESLRAIPAAATSPLAFVAYVVLVAAWVVVALRVKRNRNLLDVLEKLPRADRLLALEREMGVVRLASDMTAEQWLRSRIHTYYLAGFAILCLTVIAILAIASFEAGDVSVAITPRVTL